MMLWEEKWYREERLKEIEEELAKERAEQKHWLDKITLDDAKVLGELRYTKKIKQMKTATYYRLQKLQKAGLVFYVKNGKCLERGWHISYEGFLLWQKVRKCPLLRERVQVR